MNSGQTFRKKNSKSFHILPCQKDTFGAWSRMLKLIGVLYREFDEELSRKCNSPLFYQRYWGFFLLHLLATSRKHQRGSLETGACLPCPYCFWWKIHDWWETRSAESSSNLLPTNAFVAWTYPYHTNLYWRYLTNYYVFRCIKYI